ncbi:MAG: hypothetical protein ACR2MP_16010 [Streptosporangiaceae bacterium]
MAQTDPGQAGGRAAGQYALACSAYELLTGQPPFRREEAAAVVYAQLSEPPPALTAQRPDLPPDADQVVAKAMAKAPGDRYATCRDFADALRTALGLASYASGPGRIQDPGHPPTEVVGVPTEDAPIPAPLPPPPGGAGGLGGAGSSGDGSAPVPLCRRRRAVMSTSATTPGRTPPPRSWAR